MKYSSSLGDKFFAVVTLFPPLQIGDSVVGEKGFIPSFPFSSPFVNDGDLDPGIFSHYKLYTLKRFYEVIFTCFYTSLPLVLFSGSPLFPVSVSSPGSSSS